MLSKLPLQKDCLWEPQFFSITSYKEKRFLSLYWMSIKNTFATSRYTGILVDFPFYLQNTPWFSLHSKDLFNFCFGNVLAQHQIREISNPNSWGQFTFVQVSYNSVEEKRAHPSSSPRTVEPRKSAKFYSLHSPFSKSYIYNCLKMI